MTIDTFDPEDALLDISRKLSNVSIHKLPTNGSVEKEALPTIKYLLFSSDRDQIKQSIRLLRRYLTQGHSDENSVSDLLELGILPRIKELMEADFGNVIKFEAAWIVTNVAAGTTEQTQAIIKEGFVDLLLQCMSDKKSKLDLKAQAAWALGNVAGESASYREELMSKGFTHSIVNVLNSVYDEIYDEAVDNQQYNGKMVFSGEEFYSNIEALLWALSNMCRGGFRVAEFYPSYLPMFDVFSKYIVFNFPKIEIEVCWGLSRILYNMHDVLEFHNAMVLTDDLCERLTELLRIGTPKVVVPAIRSIVNITSGPNSSVAGLLRTQLLESITRLLDPIAPNEIRKDAYLVVSNLAAGNDEMIKYVVDHKVVMGNVVAHITVPGHTYNSDSNEWTPNLCNAYYYREDEWKVTKEALWIICNIISLGSDSAVWDLLHENSSLPRTLSAVLAYPELPLEICEKTVESLISLIQRSNKWIDVRFPNGKNPFVRIIIDQDVHEALPHIEKMHPRNTNLHDMCLKLDKLLLASEEDVIKTVNISDIAGMASAFGLPTIVEIKSKSNKRRVIRGREDGDIRLIENAVGNLCI
ncbi:hypothetical protein INT47_009702 [Mucor saturninus]|uniref:Importin subunit alpha n=1 Tax=Mucor saturninus TaxID=64648 RepID=A0A8H7QUF2_9FUNG|nr:hypothetical protein INT47_009702 [Mucor saturninus]